MVRPIEPPEFIRNSALNPVIDVRSPGEFSQGHIPGAVNIPVFTDAERAVVGTLYVNSGREEAILKGLDTALPKTGGYLELLHEACPCGTILLYCWRGGLRSTLMAEVFSHAGYHVDLLKGGYKAYRQFIRNGLAQPVRIMVLGGFTGSGKTELLKAIAEKGEQVVDLEGLACHKGSVFGALGQPCQPTNEQFENNLYARWLELDHSRLIWIEDESRMIGKVTLPDPVVEHLSNSPMIRVQLDVNIRINRLVTEYSVFEKQALSGAIRKIGERLGGEKTREAIAALESDRFEVVAALSLSYYDKAYLFSVSRRRCKKIFDLLISGTDIETDAKKIIELAGQSQ